MTTPDFIPAATNERFSRVFAWYVRRLLRKRFNALRLATGGRDVFEQAACDTAPLVVAFNHVSWWDPLLGFHIARQLTPTRPTLGPMDADQLRRFAMLRKIGVFGIDPDDPASLGAMRDYVVPRLRTGDALWIPPQGRFEDPRTPVRVRPGAAAVVSALAERANVISLAIELPFWQDQRPEVSLRAALVQAPDQQTTASWHRVIGDAMQSNADALAELVRARDPSAFEILDAKTARAEGRINPVYDLMLRLRGRPGAIPARRDAQSTESEGAR